MTTDERGGKPSASALNRLANCPASWNLSKGMPDEPSGPEAESGRRIHKWLETGDNDDWLAMSDEEQEVAERCEQQAHQLVAEFLPARDVTFIATEVRLALNSEGNVFDVVRSNAPQYIFSGQADRIVVAGDSAIVIDYKSLRGDHSHAMDNEQLRGLAVLAARRWALKYVRVAIVQPLAGPPTVADYSTQALAASYDWLRHILAKLPYATEDDARVGKWCHYCRAKTACKAFLARPAEAVTAITTAIDGTDKVSPETMAMVARGMSNDHLAWHLDQLRLVGWYVDTIKKEALARLSAGVRIDGWQAKETAGRETITDLERVWHQLAPMGCTASDFAAACTMTKAKLKPLLKRLSGAKGRALDALMDETTAGAVTVGATSTKLVRLGAELEEGE